MQFRKTAISMSIIASLALVGCGGSSSDNPPKVETKKITVIDGYLGNVEVCIDRDENKSCDAGESIGFTNSDGTIEIAKADEKYSIITKVNAGTSADSDRIGYVRSSYEMIATADSNVVTPFTTLAEARGITIAELAADLNISADVVSGDYVLAKGTSSSARDAKVAHALARSLVNELPTSVIDLDGESLGASSALIKTAIEDHENSYGTDILNDVDFILNGDEVINEAVISDLKSYLVGDEPTRWYFVSMNTSYATDEGVFMIEFGEDTYDVAQGGEWEYDNPYSIDGNNLFVGGDEQDEFIYTSTEIALAIPMGDDDLNIWSTNDLEATGADFTSEQFDGKTWYFIIDDSQTQTPDPMLLEITFNVNGSTSITQGGSEETGTWSLSQGNLVIDDGAGDLAEFSSILNSSHLMVMIELDRDFNGSVDAYSLATQDKNLAQSIVDKWAK
ncbi:hypothetical protein L4C54_08145 [Vibrio lamellibrachiae]|uniref:hypothetical protein n=1 Tax=Vibrio lamellibrachiae TaxID=2910253 RepID=UPI003D14AA74